jgi:hypothetical protein
MPYVPNPPTTGVCAFCNKTFEKRHASRKYCSNSCNVQASYARTGYRGELRATRADLEKMVAEMKQLLGQITPNPAAEAATKPTKKITTPAPPKPAAKAAATKPTPPKPAAKAASRPAPEPTPRQSPQEIYSPNGPKEVVASKPALAEARAKVQEAAALLNAKTKAMELALQIAAQLKAPKKAKKRG